MAEPLLIEEQSAGNLLHETDSSLDELIRELHASDLPHRFPRDEHDLYSAHEDETVPSGFDNAPNERYLVGAVQVALPELWVTGNGCLYWGKGPDDCAAPDLAVFQCPPLKKPARVWLSWRDPPVLFVGELGSHSNLPKDMNENFQHYEQDMKVPEYLFAYVTPVRRLKRLWIWRRELAELRARWSQRHPENGLEG